MICIPHTEFREAMKIFQKQLYGTLLGKRGVHHMQFPVPKKRAGVAEKPLHLRGLTEGQRDNSAGTFRVMEETRRE